VAGDGRGRAAFSDAAIDAVFEGSRGTPRLINLICDRALHRGHAARVARIEPSFVWDAIADLGLAVTIQAEAAPAKAAPEKAVPAPADIRKQHEQLLSDFEPEMTLRASSVVVRADPPAHGWRLLASTALVAIVAAAAALWYLSSQTGPIDMSTVTLPPPPARIAPAFRPPAPPDQSSPAPAVIKPAALMTGETNDGAGFAIQVASFESVLRAQRLVEQLTLQGYRSRIVALDFGPPRGRLVQVLVGGYPTAADAEPDLARMRARPGFADARLERVLSPEP
jgi:cell division septation protein DedD